MMLLSFVNIWLVLNVLLRKVSEVGYINQCMQAFSYWHTYYDSAFAAYPFKIPHILYVDLQISTKISKWPTLNLLPQLPKVFQLFEEAILNEENWISSLYSQEEIQDFESNVNLIVVNLQCQKKYAAKFWEKDHRRVQASIVHFSLFFKHFIGTLIPMEFESLFQASSNKKLAFSLKKLEILVNDILSHLKSIQMFLFQQSFKQEQQLVRIFLSNFIQLLQNLPKVTKKTLKQIPRLMEFICIVNPLEAEKRESSQSIPTIRKKNATEADHVKPKTTRLSQEKRKFTNDSPQQSANSPVFKKKHEMERYSLASLTPKDLAKHVSLFKFKQKMRTQSIYRRSSKKPTISSFQTKQKTASISNSRSPSIDKSQNLIEHQTKKRTETQQERRPKLGSFYVEKSSRQTSSRTVYQKDKSLQKKKFTYDTEDIEQQRDNKLKKKKATKVTIKITNCSNFIDLQKGRQRGWGFLREWFKKRLVNRKLKALLNEF